MKTLVILGLILMAGFIIYFLICEWGKRVIKNDKVYENLYRSIQFSIENDKVNEANRKQIEKRIEWLRSLPGDNPEKTLVLEMAFAVKYDGAEEHSPDAIFIGE